MIVSGNENITQSKLNYLTADTGELSLSTHSGMLVFSKAVFQNENLQA